MQYDYVDKRVIRTKKGFKEALLILMRQKKMEEITITDIVRTADFNRGTFYAHYHCKEDLLNEVIEDVLKNMEESLKKPYQDLDVVDLEQLSPKSIVLFDHFIENKDFYKLMLNSNMNYNFYQKLSERLEIIFRNDFDLRMDLSEPSIDVQLFSTYRIHGITGLIVKWIQTDFTHSSSYMAEQFINILKCNTKKIHIKN